MRPTFGDAVFLLSTGFLLGVAPLPFAYYETGMRFDLPIQGLAVLAVVSVASLLAIAPRWLSRADQSMYDAALRRGEQRFRDAMLERGIDLSPDPIATALEELGDSRTEVRLGGLRRLQASEDERALPIIRRTLTDEHPAMRKLAVDVLTRRNDRGAAGEIANLVEADRGIRASQAAALGVLGDATHEALLVSRLLEEPSICIAAANALAEVGTIAAIPALRRAAETGTRPARRACTAASARIRGRTETSGALALAETGGQVSVAPSRGRLTVS